MSDVFRRADVARSVGAAGPGSGLSEVSMRRQVGRAGLLSRSALPARARSLILGCEFGAGEVCDPVSGRAPVASESGGE